MTELYESLLINQIEDEYVPTKLFKLVLIINYLLTLVMGSASFIISLYALTQLTKCPSQSLDTIIWILISSLPILVTILYYKLVISLQDYNNVARIIFLTISFCSIIISLALFNYLSFILFSFIIYVLAVHKRTKRLFLS